MSKARDEYDAEMAAIEVEEKAARAKASAIALSPETSATSELLALFVGLSVGGALGMPSPFEAAQIERDDALGEIAAELDRRIPKR